MVTSEYTEETTSRFVDAGGVRMHYNEAGSGDVPIICLHGGGPGATGWSNYRQNLPALAEHHRVLLVDLPQFGKSDPVVISEGRLAYNARVLKDMFDALGFDKVLLVGNSMGGGTSAKFTIDNPDRVEKLILMGAAGAGESLFSPLPLEGIKLLNAYWNEPSRDNMRRIIETFVYDSSFMTEELLEQRYQGSLNPEIMEARAKSRPGLEELTADMPKIKVPTLVIWGREDRYVAMDHALSYSKRIPNATLVVLPHCGHWAQYEHAETFNRYVLDFIAH